PMPGIRKKPGSHNGPGDHDIQRHFRKTGYGCSAGGGTYGKQTDSETSGSGKRTPLRNGKPGGFGSPGRVLHRRGRCPDGDQRQFVKPKIEDFSNGKTSVYHQKISTFFVKNA